MRMIDAEQCPCNDCVPPLGDSKGCSIFPCREFGEWYKNTAYDIDKVLVRISELAECNDECANNFYYGMGCDACMWSEVFSIVKRGE